MNAAGQNGGAGSSSYAGGPSAHQHGHAGDGHDVHHSTTNGHQVPIRHSVPDIPGTLLPHDSPTLYYLRQHVMELCGLRKESIFPGGQPVSFGRDSIRRLMTEDFWVCEKSDGQRVLILILVPTGGAQEVYLIDRKNQYRQVHGLFFPHHERKEARNHTLFDGELVNDVDPRTGTVTTRLLLFDCLVFDKVRMTSRTLNRRYGRARVQAQAYEQYLASRPALRERAPFDVRLKKMELGYSIPFVLDQMPHLHHASDGLIFTCCNSGYVDGTDPNILKWKPPHENTIDFRLTLRFPSDASDPQGRLPDFTAKPLFVLEQFMGDRGPVQYEYFDWLHVEDDEWEQMKTSGVQFDDRIVECSWEPGSSEQVDPVTGHVRQQARPPRWRLHRIRDDKMDGNYTSVVLAIIKSIEDGVEQEELLSAAPAMRQAWKSAERETARKIIEGARPQQPTKRTGPGPPLRGTVPGLLRR